MAEVAIDIEEIVSISYAQRWQIIPVDGLAPKVQNDAHRLNALGSSYYFGKVVLKKRRFREYLHKEWCELIERDLIKDLIEIPRDHFKSTIFSELAPMWWALPFTVRDEMLMRQLGYGDEWIKWMKRAHSQDTRTLLVSENIKNACKLGRRINWHYKDNKMFKDLFPEIQPDSSCNWSIETMTQKRTQGGGAAQGEGTFDFLGVDGALQSRHYDRVIQDDLVGKKALNSPIEMESTIEYHKLLVGAFDSDPSQPDNENDELIVGNRWSYKDLNYHIRMNEKRFRITNHSAEGGCCDAHPAGQPIFPDEFGPKKLASWRNRLGPYLYSCQFLNRPTPPGKNKFKEEWLNYYKFKKPNVQMIGKQRVLIEHEVKAGNAEGATVIPDIFPHTLHRVLVADPNHAGNDGRSRHAICVTGVHYPPTRVYLLECYADNSSHYEFVNQIFNLAEKWKMRRVYLETIAAQKWLKFHLETEMPKRRQLGKWTFEIEPLKSSNAKDAKLHRIEGVENLYARGEFWVPRGNIHGSDKFLAEYTEYPFCATMDILDVLGYSAELWDISYLTENDLIAYMSKQKDKFASRTKSSTGY